MEQELKFLNKEEAISLLKNDEIIHTFRNPAGILLGCDNDRSTILEMINNAKSLQIGGSGCRNSKHALVLEERNGNMLFVETDEQKVNEIDPILEKK